MLVIFAQPIVKLAALSLRYRQLRSGLGILDDAVPELLHECEARFHVQREKLVEVRRSHEETVPRKPTAASIAWRSWKKKERSPGATTKSNTNDRPCSVASESRIPGATLMTRKDCFGRHFGAHSRSVDRAVGRQTRTNR